jgi:hypothetical protein
MNASHEQAPSRRTTVWPPPLFFPVPVTKFVVMSVVTAGL